MNMLIDSRAQILPGMDGLCPTHLTAIRRLLQARQAGVDVLVAAPALDLDQMPAALFLKRREAAAEHLELLLQAGMPRVVIGAEVLWHPSLEWEALPALCTGDGRLLLRLPDGRLTEETAASLERLQKQVRGVIIAGMERVNEEDVQRLFAMGCKGQLTFSALSHHHDRERWLQSLQRGEIVALGSEPGDDRHAYHRLPKLSRKLDGALEAVMERTAELLETASDA